MGTLEEMVDQVVKEQGQLWTLQECKAHAFYRWIAQWYADRTKELIEAASDPKQAAALLSKYPAPGLRLRDRLARDKDFLLRARLVTREQIDRIPEEPPQENKHAVQTNQNQTDDQERP